MNISLEGVPRKCAERHVPIMARCLLLGLFDIDDMYEQGQLLYKL